MKNKKMALILMLSFCLVLLVACKGSNESAVSASSSPANIVTEKISVEDAQNRAITHSGIEGKNANMVSVEFEEDENIYDVEFCTNDMQYDYEINATTGQIIFFEKESNDNQVAGKDNNSGTCCKNYMTENHVKAIALAYADFQEKDVSNVHVTSGYDENHLEYEVEFCKGNSVYKYEISACTGAVLSSSIFSI